MCVCVILLPGGEPSVVRDEIDGHCVCVCVSVVLCEWERWSV